MPHFVNDGSRDDPKLQVYINADNLIELRPGSRWPGLTGAAQLEQLAADGFDGLQVAPDTVPAPGSPLRFCACDRINSPGDADTVAARHAARGHTCATVHVGWGLEDDDDVFRLVEATLSASDRHRLPIFIETHRATITQDLWRTVRIVKRFPGILLNGDFSHYYAGQEMVYGGFDKKLAFMQPILDRIGFLHGRIASPGCMQVPVDTLESRPQQAHGEANYLEHFREMWTRAMAGFLRAAGSGDVLIFTPELLPGRHYYARLFPDAQGRLVEETDRYQQALLLAGLARDCFARARTGA